MVIKDISKIIIDAENGTLRFDDANRSMTDCGAVKFIYDQKNDAELCIAFVSACERMIGELNYDGIYPVLKHSLGNLYMNTDGYQQLKNKNGLISVLKPGTKNQVVIEMPVASGAVFSVGEQKESGKEWVSFSEEKNRNTLTTRFVDFALKYNQFVSESSVETSSKPANKSRKKNIDPTM